MTWRAVICLCAALLLGVPRVSHAQYADSDEQNPQEYTEDDSHPLRMIAYILAPIGFTLEWCIARPMHYVATSTFLSPVFNGVEKEPEFTPPFPLVPPDKIVEEDVPPSEEATPAAVPSSAKRGAKPKSAAGAAPPAASGRQPVLH